MSKSKNNIDTNTITFGSDLDFASAEAYNLLRTCITFSFPEDEGEKKGKVIATTSASPSEGKSYTSVNLACSLAESGKKVALIDCDMRRPSLASKLDLPLSPGLSNILVNSSGNPGDKIHRKAIHELADVVTAGDIPPNPSELLGSARMQRLVAAFTQRYDYVILDLPPVLSVSDPLIVTKIVDGYIVVLKHGSTSKGELQEAIRQMKMMEAHILGFVYNGYRKEGGSYRKYYKNKYKYEYSKE